MKKDSKSAKPVLPLTEEELEAKKKLRRKRVIAVLSLAVALGLIVWLTVFVTNSFLAVDREKGEDLGDAALHFKELIESYGGWGVLVAFGIQVLQVVVSPIPGEVIETGMGLAFGWFWGAAICLAGCALSSWIIMLFVRKYGVKFVELFISVDKINNLRFLNSEKKLERFVLILYILPGTPKDPLIFFFGLTRIRISSFVLISTLARIPSIVTSTIGGHLIQEKNYAAASVVCLLLYKKILNAIKNRGSKNARLAETTDGAENAEDEKEKTKTEVRENVGDDTNGI